MKRFLTCFLSLSLLLLTAGCEGGFQKDMDFTSILPGNITTLDPQTASSPGEEILLDSLFEGLCRMGEDGKLLPGAAEKWESTTDDRVFTFRLRGGLQWSDGTPLTAGDFLYGFQRALTPQTGSPSVDDMFIIQNARAIYNGEAGMDTLGVEVRDDRTLVVTLEESYPDFPVLTTGIHYMPCQQAYFEQSTGHYGLSSAYLITNGPFTFSNAYAWQTDRGKRKVELKRSTTYRGDRNVTPGTLTYLVDYDEIITTDPIRALKEGKADILTLSEPQAKAAAEANCQIEVLEDATFGLLFNPQSEALKQPQARELFFKTIQRQDLLSRRTSETISKEAAGIMPACITWDGVQYYEDGTKIFTQQDDSVVSILPSLLTMMEWEQLPGITVLCPDDEESISIANGLLIAWNSKLNNAFNLKPLSERELNNAVANGEYEAALYTLRAGGTIPFDMLGNFTSTAQPLLNQDPTFDQSLHTAPFTLAACRELETYLAQQYLFYPLFSDRTYYALSPLVKNITVSPDQGINFTQALKKK